ncbi:MAG: TRAP transporter large permease subunit [Anaerolineae bacterium]|nr:TRAP transporter large permease subunit [Anaerolineae bacterium]
MRKGLWLGVVVASAILCAAWATRAGAAAPVPAGPLIITGWVHDTQGQPVKGAHVVLEGRDGDPPLSEATSQPDGHFTLDVPVQVPDGLHLHVERAHFRPVDVPLEAAALDELRHHHPVALEDIALTRRIDAAFGLATLVFILVLVFIATGWFHNTLAALLGAVLVLGFSYLAHLVGESLFIFDFAQAMAYVDWNVVFLVMGMMIVIAVVERTGIFQWLAYTAYRISGGRAWLLLPILMVVTGVASAFLDNVTTMLLMTPITVQIALTLGINPLSLLIPELMASNVAGISTLVGTPTNILIGSYAGISFSAFLTNLTPGVLLSLLGLVLYAELLYWRDLRQAHAASPALLARLAERARITEPEHLKKAGWVGAGMLLLFIFGERIHLLPAVTALIGATALLVWIRPDIEEMIEAVDWTTLVFFIALFIVVGAIQEVGLVSMVADLIGRLVGGSLVLSMLAVTWMSALLSTVVANIPFTAAMLPVVGHLMSIVPGAHSQVLFYCLSVGSAMGGNGSLIGASANMVTAGIAERAGYPITYACFLKKGMPALLLTVALASVWLLVRFLVLGPGG